MKYVYLLASLWVMSPSTTGYSQSKTLMLEEAIDLALSNNQEIAIQRKQVDIAQNSVYKGNAGLLPTISLVGNGSYSQGNTKVVIRTFAENPSPVSIEEDGVATQQLSAVVQADYTLIGGFSGKYRYRLLQRAATLQGYQQEILANNVVLSVAELFMEVAKLQRREELLQETMTISQERLAKINDQFAFGKATGLDILRAETDLSQDQNALDNVRLTKNNLVKDLNFLTGQPAESTYPVAAVYQVPLPVSVDSLKQQVLRSNPERKLQAESLLMAQEQRKLTQANLYPRLSTFANYGYQRQENDVQQLAELENLGYTVGLALRYPLYRGGQTRRSLQNDQLTIEAERIRQQQVQDRLVSEAVKEHSNLAYLQAQLAREEANLDTFEESFRRTQEQYYNGKATSLDIRVAQTALLNAKVVISDIQAEVVKSFMRLEKLRGRLFENIS